MRFSEQLGQLLNRVSWFWSTYHIGTICAVLSAVFVFTTDIKLFRQFLHTDHKLKNWFRLALYTVLRVIFTICVYFGPAWTVQMLYRIISAVRTGMQRLYALVGTWDSMTVILLSTGVVVAVFLGATALAVRHHFRMKRRARQQVEWSYPQQTEQYQMPYPDDFVPGDDSEYYGDEDEWQN